MSTNLIREFFDSSQLAGGNADYVESLYDTWLADPESVPAEWNTYFKTFKGRESGDVSHTAAIARIEAAQKHRPNGVADPACQPFDRVKCARRSHTGQH